MHLQSMMLYEEYNAMIGASIAINKAAIFSLQKFLKQQNLTKVLNNVLSVLAFDMYNVNL